MDNTVILGEHGMGIKNPCVLVSMMEKRIISIKEVKLEKGGKCGPQNVYIVKSLNDVLGV